MRPPKAPIGLSGPHDQLLLSFMADSRYLTRSQLLQFMRLNHAQFSGRIFDRRMPRLVRSGLVRKEPFSGEAVYSISRGGILALERLGTYYLGASAQRQNDPHEVQIPHLLEVNNIRLALMRTQTLSRWIPESLIRVLNLSPAHAYAKVYDGVASVNLSGGRIEFAVEYERTLKAPFKYQKICKAIESETRLDTFLYLVPTSEVMWSLVREFQRTTRLVVVALVREFKEKVFDAEVWTPKFDRMPLKEALLRLRA